MNATHSRFSRTNSTWKFPTIGHLVSIPEHILQYPALKAVRHHKHQSAFSNVKTAVRVPRAGLTWGDVLQGLGTVLAIGGIVLGIHIGGWLGLGVALLLFLVGCFIGLFGVLKNGDLP